MVSKLNWAPSAASPPPPAPSQRSWPMDRWSPGAMHGMVEIGAWKNTGGEGFGCHWINGIVSVNITPHQDPIKAFVR